MTQIMYDISVV